MKIISVQSIAGGTGVTAFALEMAEAARAEGDRVLVIDTNCSPGLGQRTHNLHYMWVLDYRSLFDEPKRIRENRPAFITGSAIVRMPLRPQLSGSVSYTSGQAAGDVQTAAAPLNLRRNLGLLAASFDVAIIDVENGNFHAMMMFSEICDEIHFIERAPNGTFALWQERVGSQVPGRLTAPVITHPDMSEALRNLGELEFEATYRKHLAAGALRGIEPQYDVCVQSRELIEEYQH